MQTHRIHEDSSRPLWLALAGLALFLGLILGWVLGRASAPASLDRLPPEQKAEYVAAVADAYVAAGGQGQAAALALERLRAFQEPAQAVDEAIRYFQEQELSQRGDRNIRQVNIRFLATLLAQSEPSVSPSQVEEQAVPAQAEAQPSQESAGSRLNQVLGFLIALLLLGAMFAWAVRLRLQNAKRFVEQQRAGGPRSHPPKPPSIVETSSPSPPWDRSQEIRPGGPVSPDPPGGVLELTPEPTGPALETESTVLDADSEWDRLEEARADEKPSGPGFSRIVPRAVPGGREKEGEAAPEPNPSSRGSAAGREEAKTDAPRGQVVAEDVPLPARLASLTPQGLRQRLFRQPEPQGPSLLGEFTAHYRLGIPDYDESFTVLAEGADGAEPLGACGMGAHREFEMGDGGGEHIWALDVWLYDRQDIRSHSQLLVSQAVPRERLQSHTDSAGTVTGEPLVPEPGMRFTLAGRHLQLECQVRRVMYVESGPAEGAFAELELAMTVSRGGGG